MLYFEKGTTVHGDMAKQIEKVMKEATSEDVFERFGKWLPEGWKNWCAGYREYMKPFGFEF